MCMRLENFGPGAENSMTHDLGDGAPVLGAKKFKVRHGNVLAAGKLENGAGKRWAGAENSLTHEMGEWASLVTPRLAKGGFFIFPYRGVGVFGWLVHAPWHGAVKNVHAAGKFWPRG